MVAPSLPTTALGSPLRLREEDRSDESDHRATDGKRPSASGQGDEDAQRAHCDQRDSNSFENFLLRHQVLRNPDTG